VKAALTALGLDAEQLQVALVQFAVLYRGGQKVQMSTRSGSFVTLRELRSEVGNDAARFYYVLRKSDQHLDFDLDLAKSQSTDNPVYYIQYAHARVCSVLAAFAEKQSGGHPHPSPLPEGEGDAVAQSAVALNEWGGNASALNRADLALLVSGHELALMKRLLEYPEIVEAAARELSPHHVAYYLKDLAGDFHTYYNAEKFLVDDEALKLARLALVSATRQVLSNGLALLGVKAPEKM
jgi:arginyl-tRNA synthetase